MAGSRQAKSRKILWQTIRRLPLIKSEDMKLVQCFFHASLIWFESASGVPNKPVLASSARNGYSVDFAISILMSTQAKEGLVLAMS